MKKKGQGCSLYNKWPYPTQFSIYFDKRRKRRYRPEPYESEMKVMHYSKITKVVVVRIFFLIYPDFVVDSDAKDQFNVFK